MLHNEDIDDETKNALKVFAMDNRDDVVVLTVDIRLEPHSTVRPIFALLCPPLPSPAPSLSVPPSLLVPRICSTLLTKSTLLQAIAESILKLAGVSWEEAKFDGKMDRPFAVILGETGSLVFDGFYQREPIEWCVRYITRVRHTATDNDS